MQWMDGLSVTEMDRGGVSKMDTQQKCQKMEKKTTEMDQILQHIGGSVWKHWEKHDFFFLDFWPKKLKVFDILVIKTFC